MPRPHAFLPIILWGLKILSSPQERHACSTRGNPQNRGFTGSQGGVGRARSSAAAMLILPTAAGAPPSRSRVARPVTSLPQIFPELASGLHPRPPARPTSLTPQAKAGLWGSFHRPWIQGCSQGSIQSGPNTYVLQARTPMFKFLGNSEAQNTREGRKKEPQN